METIILVIAILIISLSVFHCYKIAKKRNLNKVVAIIAGVGLFPIGMIIYSYLDRKIDKKNNL